jgi:hypothetical protein
MVKQIGPHAEQTPPRPFLRLGAALLVLIGLLAATTLGGGAPPANAGDVAPEGPTLSMPHAASQAPAPQAPVYKVISWNDLGMHCMNENFANLAVLPPYNTLWAQVILQGAQPQIVTSGVTINYDIVDNTYSVGKTNFWTYAQALFGAPLAPNVGLKGATLRGSMQPATDHFVVEGVPLTPYLDSAPGPGSQYWYPYQRAHVVAKDATTDSVLAETITVAPVSTEMRCDTCHANGKDPGGNTGNVETNILAKHDDEEHTSLMASRPVLCAKCHASNALGAPGQPGVPNLSRAMHDRHALEPGGDEGTNDCYLCHPGQQTKCLRDVMYQKGLTCIACHGNTAAVANPVRNPWVDLPRCGDSHCHGAKYAEETGKRYRDSKGHGGVYCEACHGSPHAILPTVVENDNVQNIALQGHPGTLEDCRVCHGTWPDGPGPHGALAKKFRVYLPVILASSL